MPTPFDEIEFPIYLSFDSRGGPEFKNTVIETNTGLEYRMVRWRNPVHVYDCKYAVKTPDDLANVQAFYIARQGSTRGFRFRDFADSTSNADGVTLPTPTDQTLVVIDSTHYQLVKVYKDSISSTYTRNIYKPIAGTVVVAVNGTQVFSGWTVDTTKGIIAFGTHPSGTVKAGFEFDVPVRFDDGADTILSATVDDFGSGSMDSVPITEIKIGFTPVTGTDSPPLAIPVSVNT
jgi:uncharacterized protein (TIGR02217 family)